VGEPINENQQRPEGVTAVYKVGQAGGRDHIMALRPKESQRAVKSEDRVRLPERLKNKTKWTESPAGALQDTLP